MILRYFLITDILLAAGFMALELMGAPAAACCIIALQFSTACTAACLARSATTRKKYYSLLTAALLIHGSLNIIGVIAHKSALPGLQAPEIYLPFTVPMLFILTALCHYFFATIDRYDRHQLLLDTYKVAVVVITAMGAVAVDAYQRLDNFHWHFSPLYIALIVHILIICLLFILSFISLFSKRKRQSTLAFPGIILFCLLITAYQFLFTCHMAGVLDCNAKIAEYMLIASCLILSTTLRYHDRIQRDENFAMLSPDLDQPENIGKTYTTLFLALITTAIWAAGILSTPLFILVILVLFILQRMDLLVQRLYATNVKLTRELTIDSLTGLNKKRPFRSFFRKYCPL